MLALSRILVDVDATADTHPALQQAVGLAARCGASLKLVDVVPEASTGAAESADSAVEQEERLAHRRERLAALAATVRDVPITTEVLRGEPATALTQEVLHAQHHLLMRSHGRGPGDEERPLGAVDLHLLRECPCSVWVVRKSTKQLRRILAAVHTTAGDTVERGLNTTVLELALLLSHADDAHLTVLQTWTAFGESLLRSHGREEEVAGYTSAQRGLAEEALSAFMASFDESVRALDTVLLEGEPWDVIPEFVASHGIDVVVMGTVARTGLSGLVVGNTAERVLERLQGSVVAVKPPGFESPVRP
ncbi:MAG: universal stress protein [Vicinamibacterales bacterium]